MSGAVNCCRNKLYFVMTVNTNYISRYSSKTATKSGESGLLSQRIHRVIYHISSHISYSHRSDEESAGLSLRLSEPGLCLTDTSRSQSKIDYVKLHFLGINFCFLFKLFVFIFQSLAKKKKKPNLSLQYFIRFPPERKHF